MEREREMERDRERGKQRKGKWKTVENFERECVNKRERYI
jgi:hypothetical protein